ncbi:sugar ABC transporter substrate-binding protein [Catenulispora yoronensis]|uniref:Sugar ABC transporter substrate-binding protein n=1 Tax=Catenulispora yoronensis TaxID=450799 RepID=A0ABP5FQD4_9ACTN
MRIRSTTWRRTAAAVTALAAAAALTACGSSKAGGSGASGTTVKMWVMGDAGNAFKTLTSDWSKQSGIKVDVQAIPWSDIHTKLTTAVASGNGPDVVQVGYSLVPTFRAAGALADLSSYAAAHPALQNDAYLAGASPKTLNPDGKLDTVPWISDTRVLFYRSDVLAAAGISKPPATWAELHDDAVTLAKRGSGKYGYYIPQWDLALPVEFAWQAGGDVTDASGAIKLDTPQLRSAVDYYLSFYKDKAVPTAADFDQVAGFVSGAAPMVISGPYLAKSIETQAPDLKGKWATVPLPAGPAGGTSLFAGSGLGVWKNSKNTDAALKLLDFLAAPATQVKWFQLDGDLPSVKSALSDPALAADPNVAVYVKQLDDAKLLPLNPAWDKVDQDLLDSLNKMALQGADVTQTLAKLAQDAQEQQK